MKKIIFLSGSIRKDSLNKKLAKSAYKIAKDHNIAATYIDLKDYSMPIYDGDLEEKEGLPENAKKLKKLFIENDGFFIASPEYNSAVSPLLKNTLDWISRKETPKEEALIAFKNKIAAISSVSPGPLGGLRGLYSLRDILLNINVTLVPDQIAIHFTDGIFDENDFITDKRYKNSLTTIIEKLSLLTVSR